MSFYFSLSLIFKRENVAQGVCGLLRTRKPHGSDCRLLTVELSSFYSNHIICGGISRESEMTDRLLCLPWRKFGRPSLIPCCKLEQDLARCCLELSLNTQLNSRQAGVLLNSTDCNQGTSWLLPTSAKSEHTIYIYICKHAYVHVNTHTPNTHTCKSRLDTGMRFSQ